MCHRRLTSCSVLFCLFWKSFQPMILNTRFCGSQKEIPGLTLCSRTLLSNAGTHATALFANRPRQGKMGLARVAHMAGESVLAAFVLTTFLTIVRAATPDQSEAFPALGSARCDRLKSFNSKFLQRSIHSSQSPHGHVPCTLHLEGTENGQLSRVARQTETDLAQGCVYDTSTIVNCESLGVRCSA